MPINKKAAKKAAFGRKKFFTGLNFRELLNKVD
jgi:hypothetical protein